MNAEHKWSSMLIDDGGEMRVCFSCGLVERVKKAPGHSHGRRQWQREVAKGPSGIVFILLPPCDPTLKPRFPKYGQ